MHLHEMRDSDKHFIINPTTMVITNNSAKHTLQQGDHNSEIYTFEIPKMVEGHDMTLCNLVQIHYINIKGDKTEQIKDVHKVTDIAVSEDEPGTLVFTWTVHGNATKYAGSLNFRIHFYCTDTDGKYTYKKHTEIFKGITISEGFDNAEAVKKDHSDILAQWENRLNALENSGGGSADGAVLYTEQTLTEEEKAIARENIGAMQNGKADCDLDMDTHGIKSVDHMSFTCDEDGTSQNTDNIVSVLASVKREQEESNDYSLSFRGFNSGRISIPKAVRLSNIADGTQDTDAATVGQVKEMVQQSGSDTPIVRIGEYGPDDLEGNVGDLFIAKATGALYKCTGIGENNRRFWELIFFGNMGWSAEVTENIESGDTTLKNVEFNPEQLLECLERYPLGYYFFDLKMPGEDVYTWRLPLVSYAKNNTTGYYSFEFCLSANGVTIVVYASENTGVTLNIKYDDIGNIEAALDSILAIQEHLMGGNVQ